MHALKAAHASPAVFGAAGKVRQCKLELGSQIRAGEGLKLARAGGAGRSNKPVTGEFEPVSDSPASIGAGSSGSGRWQSTVVLACPDLHCSQLACSRKSKFGKYFLINTI